MRFQGNIATTSQSLDLALCLLLARCCWFLVWFMNWDPGPGRGAEHAKMYATPRRASDNTESAPCTLAKYEKVTG